MKADIHPNYDDIKVTCSCGNEFTTRSTLGEDLLIEVCSSCHPFYTGKQKKVDTGGRVDNPHIMTFHNPGLPGALLCSTGLQQGI